MDRRRMQSFLVRVVLEEAESADGEYHGRIQHISSGADYQFNDAQELLQFIGQICAAAQAPVVRRAPKTLPDTPR